MIEVSANTLTQKTIVKNRRTPDGPRRSTEYQAWAGMKDRCLNPNGSNWKNYGGRGITVCERWMLFERFFEDMGFKPSPKHTLERKNNALGYSPENCRWATSLDQNNNRRDNHIIEFEGERRTVAAWERHLGWRPGTLKRRILLGWDPNEAIREPVKQSGPYIVFNGKRQTITEWAQEIGCPRNRIATRLRRGWSLERALS